MKPSRARFELTRMKYDNGLYFGTVDLSIGDIVEEIPAFFKDLAMVVTRVDSRGIVTFKPEWEALHRMERRGHAAVFPPYGVVKLIENKWPFDGFEEIFFSGVLNANSISGTYGAVQNGGLALLQGEFEVVR